MKPQKRALTELWGEKEQKIVASLGFTSFYVAFSESIFSEKLYVKLFCQTIYQNGYNSTHIVVHGAEALKKKASWVKWSRVKWGHFSL